MLDPRKVEMFPRAFAIPHYALLAVVASAVLAVTGCSDRKSKHHPPASPTITTTALPEGEVGVA
ncbi:MAG: hypothetical protein DRP82_05230, partial [Planctomycetota bacterium]